MPKRVTIWTLNKAADLINGKESEILSMFKDPSAGIEYAFGNRNLHISKKKLKISHSLTSEEKSPDEYFVPVPLKCVGSKYKNIESLDAEGKRFLNGIINNSAYFQDEQRFRSFWDEGYGPLNRVRMNSINYSGYYEILEKTKPNILIGYSQGGLTARYLAFLDEYVFKQNAIIAIITVQAPNYGSPLANPLNRESVTDAINKLFLTILSMNPIRYPSLNKFKNSTLDFEDITGLIENLLDDFSKIEDLEKSEKSLRDTLIAAEKWLSGLTADSNSAFHDLSVMNFEEEYSVLNLVNNYPLQRIYYGAIIGANNDFDQFIKSLVGSFLGQMGWYFIKKKTLFHYPIADNIQSATDVYNLEMMTESKQVKESANRQINEIIKNYEEGIPSLGIKPRAHDFIIPSVSQILPVSDSDRFLGNIINKNAGHNSGKSREYKPGEKNYKHIFNFLKQLKKRIAYDFTINQSRS